MYRKEQDVTEHKETQSAIKKSEEKYRNLVENLPEAFRIARQGRWLYLNLLKNAIESMPNGGRIVTELKQSDGRVSIRFIDQGCGIPKDMLKKLGQTFLTTKEKGTGLGLMVSCQIIESHKETIHFESEEQKGTTVHLSLPVVRQVRQLKFPANVKMPAS
ncbi:ATP-binding protein [Effusibacillus dendaii]|uniref:histidine kinase n=1 Tax=Effusibacillus dendaii TaxID=2743772 RepID=A0A7I8DEZ4_9BACL|nr:ATP-binding protein [Effusibacillus dendaii]BCJ87426.1 hypothetical protein skT53_24110 [Effusibacillus dendaii]